MALRVVMIGGTGFLGYFTCRALAARGHEVIAVGLPDPDPPSAPPGVRVTALDTDKAGESELDRLLAGADVLIHAAGADGRACARPPALEAFARRNVDPFFRLLPAMKRAGADRLVILGSYYTAIARQQPELPVMTRSAYPISRAQQAELVFALAGEEISVAILELPYIFGAAPGQGTLWGHVIDTIIEAKGPVGVATGGTACITARQAGRAAALVAERATGHAFHPVATENLTHLEIYRQFARALQLDRTFFTLAPEVALAAASAQAQQLEEAGIETGYDPFDLAVLQAADLSIDPAPTLALLEEPADDIAAAIAETVAATRRFVGAGPSTILLE